MQPTAAVGHSAGEQPVEVERHPEAGMRPWPPDLVVGVMGAGSGSAGGGNGAAAGGGGLARAVPRARLGRGGEGEAAAGTGGGGTWWPPGVGGGENFTQDD